ncbi:MAG: enoyl-CoA hydratase/isomerase family protein [Candidatus Dormibacteraeota bacterium]|nr:enoyl-CoA hydratase/isomerase family protein [Candidatus Dormibacteraeota bacterium]MBO0761381.1 enoyl-CoA hydratase/isomerase family protein [Candidatus Dormibacteraeota bacterium]
MGACVDVRRDGAVATVVMHREKNNAIAEDLLTELREAFATLGSDPEVRAIVLASGFDRYFSVGADLGAMAGIDRTAADAEEQILAMVRRDREGYQAIASCPKPVVAALNGHTLGGGCELALCCDYRIMVEDERSRIGQPEVGLGIIPGAGGTQRLLRLVGRARALPMLLEGARLSAREAVAVGLVDRAVAPEELDGAVRELAGRLAAGPTVALAMIKDAVDRGQDLPLDEALEIEGRNFVRAALSDDAAIGVMSFLAKQTPQFTGR